MSYFNEPRVLFLSNHIIYFYRGWQVVIAAETGQFLRFSQEYRQDSLITGKLNEGFASAVGMSQEVFDFFMMVQQIMEETYDTKFKLGKPVRSAKSAPDRR